eukprot:gene9010-10676_t
MKKILCLHGYRTNTDLMKFQCALIEENLRGQAEFDYLEAPFVSDAPYDAIVGMLAEPPYYQWSERGKPTMQGLFTGVQHIEDYVRKHGPFSAILGFSQGGAMAILVAALQRRQLEGLPELRISEALYNA